MKFDPVFTPFGKGFGELCGSANLGYQVDRVAPYQSIVKTTFATALSDIEQHMDFTPVACSVSIEHNFNPTSRELTGSVKVHFDDVPKGGKYKVMLYVMEDSVVYKQYDYGMSTDFGVPYVSPAIGYIDNWYHNHVLRDGIISGDSLWGEVVVTDPSKGDTFTINFDDSVPTRYPFSGPGTITIPAPYDPEKVQDEQVSLLAFVTRNDTEVVNSAVKRLDDTLTTAVVEPLQPQKSNHSIMVEENYITVTNVTSSISASLLTTNGRVVKSLSGEMTNGVQRFTIGREVSRGVYLLQLSDRDGAALSTKRVTIK